MLSQSVICQNFPGAKQLYSCTLKSLPEVHATVNIPSARGTATANKNVKNTQKHGKNEILYYSWGKKKSVLCNESQGGE